ncbi:MAG: inorganic pyrophosphatase, partial [Bacillota bacterium]
MDHRFWEHAGELVASSRLVIDRPGSAPGLDYGYLEGTAAVDGEGVDVWRGSQPEPKVTGAIVTVDLLKRETEVKLLVGCDDEEAATALAAHNVGRQAGLLIMRGQRAG